MKTYRRWKRRLIRRLFCYVDPALGLLADGLHLLNKRIRKWQLLKTY